MEVKIIINGIAYLIKGKSQDDLNNKIEEIKKQNEPKKVQEVVIQENNNQNNKVI